MIFWGTFILLPLQTTPRCLTSSIPAPLQNPPLISLNLIITPLVPHLFLSRRLLILSLQLIPRLADPLPPSIRNLIRLIMLHPSQFPKGLPHHSTKSLVHSKAHFLGPNQRRPRPGFPKRIRRC